MFKFFFYYYPCTVLKFNFYFESHSWQIISCISIISNYYSKFLCSLAKKFCKELLHLFDPLVKAIIRELWKKGRTPTWKNLAQDHFNSTIHYAFSKVKGLCNFHFSCLTFHLKVFFFSAGSLCAKCLSTQTSSTCKLHFLIMP